MLCEKIGKPEGKTAFSDVTELELDSRDLYGRIFLHEAAKLRDVEVFKVLVEKNAKTDILFDDNYASTIASLGWSNTDEESKALEILELLKSKNQSSWNLEIARALKVVAEQSRVLDFWQKEQERQQREGLAKEAQKQAQREKKPERATAKATAVHKRNDDATIKQRIVSSVAVGEVTASAMHANDATTSAPVIENSEAKKDSNGKQEVEGEHPSTWVEDTGTQFKYI